MTKASDVRYGRQGGRIVPPADPKADAALEAWRTQRDLDTAAAQRRGQQLDLFTQD